MSDYRRVLFPTSALALASAGDRLDPGEFITPAPV